MTGRADQSSLIVVLIFCLFASTAETGAQVYGFDPSYGNHGTFTLPLESNYNYFQDAAITSSGDIIVAGRVYNDGSFLYKVQPDGSPNTSFGTQGIAEPLADGVDRIDYIYSMDLQADGKIVLVGKVNAVDNFNEPKCLFRFNADGSPDNTLNSTGSIEISPNPLTSASIHFIKALSSGKYLIGGGMNSEFYVARFNADGSLDVTFGSGGVAEGLEGFSGWYRKIALYPDGSFVAGGQTVGDDLIFAKYNSDGSLNEDVGEEGVVYFPISESLERLEDLEILPSGKILIAGYSLEVGTSDSWTVIARINEDGSVDESFGDGGIMEFDFCYTADEIFDIDLDDDGKILASGRTCFNNSNGNLMVGRLTSDGLPDEAFQTEGAFFSSFDPSAIHCAMKVFDVVSNKAVIVGYQGYNLFTARLMPGGVPSITSIPETIQNRPYTIKYLGRNAWTLVFDKKYSEVSIRITDLSGRVVESYRMTDADHLILRPQALPQGIYMLEIRMPQYSGSEKIIIQ